MSNKTDGSQKITPASHGDELDVLEALYWMDKDRETKVLSKKQKEELVVSGRISEDVVKKTGYFEGVVYSLMKLIEEDCKAGVFKDSWEDMGEESRHDIRQSVFKTQYGVFPEYFLQRMILLRGKNVN